MLKVSDEELVQQVLSGKRKAFETLVDRYQKIIFNTAYRTTRNYEDSQDITQTVFIKAFQNLQGFNPSYRFFSWLYRIAVNESINFVNQRKQVQSIDEGLISQDKTIEEKGHENDISKAIQSALLEIDINYRMVIILRHFQDCSYKEMGYILDIPEKTVKSRLFTARQLLKEILQKKGAIIYD